MSHLFSSFNHLRGGDGQQIPHTGETKNAEDLTETTSREGTTYSASDARSINFPLAKHKFVQALLCAPEIRIMEVVSQGSHCAAGPEELGAERLTQMVHALKSVSLDGFASIVQSVLFAYMPQLVHGFAELSPKRQGAVVAAISPSPSMCDIFRNTVGNMHTAKVSDTRGNDGSAWGFHYQGVEHLPPLSLTSLHTTAAILCVIA